MNDQRETSAAVLVGKSSDVAGSRFEIASNAFIGRDGAGRIAVVTSPQDLAETFAQLVRRDGAFVLEPLAARGEVRLDGVPTTRAVPLERRHILTLPNGSELVFSSAPGSRPSEPPPRASVPAGNPGKAPDPALETMVESGWSAMPDLKRKSREENSPAPAERIVTAPRARAVEETHHDANLAQVPPLQRTEPQPASPAGPAEDEVGTRVFTPPPPLPRYEVEVHVPDQATETFALKPGENVIGRSSECDIRLADPNKWLSRKHAVLRVLAESVELIDLNGMNGTYMNGNRISAAEVTPGSSFFLGPNIEFTLRQR